MQSDVTSRCRPPLGASQIRTLCVVAVGILAFGILFWMYTEQSHMQMCTDVLQGSRDDPDHKQPIQVVIQMPSGENRTLDKSEEQAHRKWDYNWDRKAWRDKEEAKGVPTRTILLVRHGQYDLNTGHLTDKGRQQANITGLRLRELGMAYNSLVHSTMDRALETAQILGGHLPNLPLTADALISEGGPTPPDPTVSYWGLPERTYFTDSPRLEAAFRKYFYRADREQERESIDLLVGHGNIFRFFILRALQFPEAAWMRVFISHASISLIHINPDGTVTLTKFGDSGHFPPELVTF